MEKDVSERDRYGRLLRYVYVGALSVNAEMVARGHANTATHPPDVRYADYFTLLEEEARKAGLGLWSSATTVSGQDLMNLLTADATAYITITGQRYYREGCPCLNESVIPLTLAEAKARGYQPCEVCNPSKEADYL